MLKTRFLIVILTTCSLLSFGQQALNFNMTDLKGRNWNLYSQLDSGRVVLLDFFYADCVPCQTLTPQVADLYSDYGADTGMVRVFGISDRDTDSILTQFEMTYGVNYPSCGTEGNGDSITQAYSSWFTFIGWPLYAVICPNKNISWNLGHTGIGLPDVRDAIDECIQYLSVESLSGRTEEFSVIFKNGSIEVESLNSLGKSIEIQIIDTYGRIIYYSEINQNKLPISISTEFLRLGLYILNVSSDFGINTYKFKR